MAHPIENGLAAGRGPAALTIQVMGADQHVLRVTLGTIVPCRCHQYGRSHAADLQNGKRIGAAER
jgi:hypothetical protein